MSESAALGFRAHSGWAAVVAVSGSPLNPVVLHRRRIQIADPAIAGSSQPFHAAEPLPFERAEALIDQCRRSSSDLARHALSAILAQLQHSGVTVAGAGILCASGRALPDLAATLRSHALIHAAEGEFFRQALLHAAGHCSLPVTKISEREIWDTAAHLFQLPAAGLQHRINALGKSLGPPWRQDEKLASLGAWITLRCV